MRSQLLILSLSLMACNAFFDHGIINYDIVQNAKNIIDFFNSLGLGNVNIEAELNSVVRPDSVNGLRDFIPCKNGDGVCTSANECRVKGGTSIGGCQNCQGCAVCCKYELPCQSRTADYITYFSSPGYPSPLRKSGACSASVSVRREVCQVRLDFLEFEMASPPLPTSTSVAPFITTSTPANCRCRRSDSLNIQNPRSAAGVFGPGNSLMCGINTGKHIYLDVNPSSLVVISATTSGTAFVPLATSRALSGNVASKWNIKITQIPCSRPEYSAAISTQHQQASATKLVDIPQYYKDLRAPAGCLEYHQDRRGQFSNFGYDGKSLLLTNLDYSVCFMNPPDTCGATFRAKVFSVPARLRRTCVDGSTEVVGASATPTPAVLAGQCCQQPGDGAAAPTTTLVTDFVGINSRSVAPTTTTPNPAPNFRTFFCGTTLGGTTNSVVQRGKGPIVARVKTSNVCYDGAVVPAGTARPTQSCPSTGCVGFLIDYSVDTGTC